MSYLVPPLVIEWCVGKWDQGSEQVADFTWPSGLAPVVVTQRVRDCLEGRFRGIRFEPVEIVETPRHQQKARRKRFPRAEDVPLLWWLKPASHCRLDLEKSGRTLLSECGTCGFQQFEVAPNSTVMVRPETWDGADMFEIVEVGDVLFVTEPVRNELMKHSFANVRVRPRGVIG